MVSEQRSCLINIKNRALLTAITCVIFTFLVGNIAPIWVLLVLAFSALTGLIIFCVVKKLRFLVFLAALPCLAGCLYFLFHYYVVYRPALQFEGQTVEVTGRLTGKISESENADYFIIRPDCIMMREKEYKLAGNIVVYFEKGSLDIPVGSAVKCRGKVFEDTDSDDLRINVRLTRRQFLSMYAETGIKTGEPRPYDIYVLTQAARDKIQAVYDHTYSTELSSFLQGLTLGQKENMDDSVYYSFKDSGVSHVLAVSGMHLTFLTSIVWMLLSLVRANLRLRSLIQLLVIWLFTAITGFSPSCCRAAVMLSVFHIGILINREADSLTSLAVSVFLCCLFNPFALVNPSLLLSASATLGILVLSPKIDKLFCLKTKKHNFWTYVYDIVKNSITMSVAATLFTMPVLALLFHSVSLASPITNVLIVVPIELLFSITFLATVFCWITPLNILVSFVSQMLYEYCKAVTSFMAGLPVSSMYSGGLRFWMFVLVIVVGSAVIYLISLKHKAFPKRAVFLTMLAVAFAGTFLWYYFPSKNVYTYFISVGQGNTAMVVSNGEAVFIDCGGSGLGSRAVEQTVLKADVHQVSAIYLTHLDTDHTKYALGIMKRYQVKRLIVPMRMNYSEDSGHLLYEAAKQGTAVECIDHDRTDLLFNNVGLNIFAEHIDPYDEAENENSLVYKLSYEGNDILFMGDLDTDGETKLLEYEDDLTCDIIEIGHHGSATSTSEQLLQKTGAKQAVISVGKDNTYGLPNVDVLRRINTCNVKVFRTDLDGTVRVVMRPTGYEILKGY